MAPTASALEVSKVNSDFVTWHSYTERRSQLFHVNSVQEFTCLYLFNAGLPFLSLCSLNVQIPCERLRSQGEETWALQPDKTVLGVQLGHSETV